jgi:hypothetical protein
MRYSLIFPLGALALAQLSLAIPFEDADIALAGEDDVDDSFAIMDEDTGNNLEARATGSARVPGTRKVNYPTRFAPLPTNNADYAAQEAAQHAQWCSTVKPGAPGYSGSSRACIDGVWDSLYKRTDMPENEYATVVAGSTATIDLAISEITTPPFTKEGDFESPEKRNFMDYIKLFWLKSVASAMVASKDHVNPINPLNAARAITSGPATVDIANPVITSPPSTDDTDLPDSLDRRGMWYNFASYDSQRLSGPVTVTVDRGHGTFKTYTLSQITGKPKARRAVSTSAPAGPPGQGQRQGLGRPHLHNGPKALNGPPDAPIVPVNGTRPAHSPTGGAADGGRPPLPPSVPVLRPIGAPAPATPMAPATPAPSTSRMPQQVQAKNEAGAAAATGKTGLYWPAKREGEEEKEEEEEATTMRTVTRK